MHDSPDSGRRGNLADVHRAVQVRLHVVGPALPAQRQERVIRDHDVGAAEARCEAIALVEIRAAELDPALAQLGHAVGIAHHADNPGSTLEQALDEVATQETRRSRHRDRRSCEPHGEPPLRATVA
jgi:hypothetical protein